MQQVQPVGKARTTHQTVTVRVQVVDMDSFTLDLQVPTYLPARDLTQRVARDAGLDAYWDNGRRRLYWLRARGRLLADQETLADLGVIDGELVYLLPEPPPRGGVQEQVPDYPENRGYLGKGTVTLLGSLLAVMLWATGWGVALCVQRTTWTVLWPGLGLGFLCISLARHAWGGNATRVRVAATGMVLFVLIFVLAFVPAVYLGNSATEVYSQSVSGFIMGLVGVLVGWVAWWGAVEPLPATPKEKVEQAQEAVAVVQCGICGTDVTAEVRTECPYGCGRFFHQGCYKARISVYRGDRRFCAVCNAEVGA